MKKLILILILFLTINLNLSASDVFFVLNNDYKDNIKIIKEDDLYISLEDFFEEINAKIKWLPEHKQVYVMNEEDVYMFEVGSKEVLVNESTKKLKEKVFIKDDEIFIPLDFLKEVLNYRIIEEANNIVRTYKDKSEYIDLEDNQDNNKKNYFKWETKDNDASISTTQLTKKDTEVTLLNDVYLENGNHVIECNDEIGEVSYSVWNNKLVVDVKNSIFYDVKKTKYLDNDDLFDKIVISQFSSDPKVVRITFENKKETNYNLFFSEDRKKLIINEGVNFLESIIFDDDKLTLNSNKKIDYEIKETFNSNEIVINLKNIVSTIDENKKILKENKLFENIKYKKGNNNNLQIIIKKKAAVEYDTQELNKNNLIIKFTKTKKEEVVDKTKLDSLEIDKIKIEHDYINGIAKIIFPGNYEKSYKMGNIIIDDSRLEDIDVQNINNKTIFTINEKSKFKYEVVREDNKIKIEVNDLKEKEKKSDKIVVIDIGHGGKDPGAVYKGEYEKDYNLEIGKMLYDKLEENNLANVYLTRKEDKFLSLDERISFANNLNADMFISLHNNISFIDSVNGTETLYTPYSSLNDFTGKKLASIIHGEIIKKVNTRDRGIKSRKYLAVLKYTKMPAAIVEFAYLSNEEDLKKLKTLDFKQKAVDGLYEGIKKAINY